ncbi:putative bifunctional diguanylate cyclase/phosphodiesterase [Planococcus sp. CAU13]|uniref:putative bifunctional diguanylate cyclase/phosphodiesterase n=1 Tax=Planococcus sp. CAU13 TaxID=1541197 RepID=UPI00052FF6C2|nr:phosphodiesterase [Planococcus sp. CAU13]
MTLHRTNDNYMSEAEKLRSKVANRIGDVMGWGNLGGGIIFGIFIMMDGRGITFLEYPVPIGMIILGLLSLLVGKRHGRDSVRPHIYLLNYMLFPLILLYFIEDAATTIWSLTFLYLLMAVTLQSRRMLLYSFVSSMVGLIILMMTAPDQLTVLLGVEDHVIRLVLISVAAVICLSGIYSIKDKEKLLFHYIHKAEETAYLDPFLKIPNRIDFNLYVDHQLKTKQLFLWKLELNQLQSVYDVLGHKRTDELLLMVTRRLKGKLPADTYLAKGEGSTFLAATSSFGREKLETDLKEMLRYLTAPYDLFGHDYQLTFNIGVALSGPDGDSSDELMRHAQFALEQAKLDGINQIVFSSDKLKSSTMSQVQVSEALYQANLDAEFHLVYQPQIELKSNQIVGVEALIRWNHPQMGMISPGLFIEIAEKNGFIVPLGKWILEKACWEVQMLSDSIGRPLKLAVNVSFIQIKQEGFVDEVLHILKKIGFQPDRLEIELTERSLFENRPEDLAKIDALRAKGIRIAIDDFGTGYSSFGILAKVKVDKIKVPRDFIENVDSNQNSQRIVTTIASMADRFQLTCLAEGIERPEENNFLHQLVCQEVQGYYYAKPAMIKQVEEWLSLPREKLTAFVPPDSAEPVSQ